MNRPTLLLFAMLALGVQPAGGDELQLAVEVRDLLGAMDFVPTTEMLDEVMGSSPDAELAAIATDPTADPGVRIRALRGLAHYPTDEARTALYGVIGSVGGATTGYDVLTLRTAIETLGVIGGPDAVPTITPFLSVGSSPEVCAGMRDVRATAANALRVIGAASAVPALRARQVPGSDKEPCEQVALAITEALRALLGGT